MGLLTTSEATAKIAEQVAGAKEHLQVVSAFCKTSTLEFIERNICQRQPENVDFRRNKM